MPEFEESRGQIRKIHDVACTTKMVGTLDAVKWAMLNQQAQV